MMLQERIRRNSLTIPVNWNIIYLVSAGWSSLEARRAHNPKVTGSNPVPAISAQIAQSVEQRTENPCVAGSIPAGATRLIPNSNFYVSSFKMLQNMVEYL